MIWAKTGLRASKKAEVGWRRQSTACFSIFATNLRHCKPQELLFRHFDGVVDSPLPVAKMMCVGVVSDVLPLCGDAIGCCGVLPIPPIPSCVWVLWCVASVRVWVLWCVAYAIPVCECCDVRWCGCCGVLPTPSLCVGVVALVQPLSSVMKVIEDIWENLIGKNNTSALNIVCEKKGPILWS
jgi:hypothetical protein